MDGKNISFFFFLNCVDFLRKQSIPIFAGWFTVLQSIYILKQVFNTELSIRIFCLMYESTSVSHFRKEEGVQTLRDSYMLDIHCCIGTLWCWLLCFLLAPVTLSLYLNNLCLVSRSVWTAWVNDLPRLTHAAALVTTWWSLRVTSSGGRVARQSWKTRQLLQDNSE